MTAIIDTRIAIKSAYAALRDGTPAVYARAKDGRRFRHLADDFDDMTHAQVIAAKITEKGLICPEYWVQMVTPSRRGSPPGDRAATSPAEARQG